MQGTQALLQWCKQNTAGYKDVSVTNFHYSWKNGLAFCALIHSFHPEAIDFNSLSKDNMEKNLELAFLTAEKLGVPRLLDVEDFVLLEKPEQFSIITYLGVIYQTFQLNGGSVAAENKRIEEQKMAENAIKKPVANIPSSYSSASKPPPRPAMKTNGQTEKPITPVKKPTQPSNGLILDNRNQLEICAKCGQTLSGNVLEALGKKYHQQCFGCTLCSRKLGASFVTVDNQAYCETCGKKVWVEKQAKKKAEEQQKLNSQEEEKKMIEAKRVLEEKQKKEKEEFERKQKEEKEKREKEMAEKKKREEERLLAIEKEKKERREREEKLKKEKEERLQKESDDREKKTLELKEKQTVLDKASPSSVVETKVNFKPGVTQPKTNNSNAEPEWKRKQREAEEKKMEMQEKLKAIKQKRLEEAENKKKANVLSQSAVVTTQKSEKEELKKKEEEDRRKKIEEEKEKQRREEAMKREEEEKQRREEEERKKKEEQERIRLEEEKRQREEERRKREEERKKKEEEIKRREEERKRKEEEEKKKKEEERKKREDEQKRIQEERKRLEEDRKKREEERKKKEEEMKRKREEELKRMAQEEERKRKEEELKKKEKEERKRLEEEERARIAAEEERLRITEEEKRIEEERKRKEEEESKKKEEEEKRKEEEERKRIEEERRREEEERKKEEELERQREEERQKRELAEKRKEEERKKKEEEEVKKRLEADEKERKWKEIQKKKEEEKLKKKQEEEDERQRKKQEEEEKKRRLEEEEKKLEEEIKQMEEQEKQMKLEEEKKLEELKRNEEAQRLSKLEEEQKVENQRKEEEARNRQKEEESKRVEEERIKREQQQKEEEEKERIMLEERQQKEREEFERKQKEEKKELRRTITKQSLIIKDKPLPEIPQSITPRRDELTQYVLRVNILMLRCDKDIKRPLFKLQLETKPSNIQSVRVNKINSDIGSSLFFKEITAVSCLTIKVIEESTKTVYQEISIPLDDLELNSITPVTTPLSDSQYPAELMYTLRLISSVEGMRQTALSVQDLRTDKPQEGVFYLRINSAKDLPVLNGVKEAYCVVTVGNQNPVQTKSIIPTVPVWNHFMAFDCKHDDQVKIEIFTKKKTLLKQLILPFGQVSMSLKGIKGIQERWLTILPQDTETVQGQLNVTLFYQDNSVEVEGADPTLLSTLSTKFERLSEKTQGDIPEWEEVDVMKVKKWDGKAGYLFIKSQKTGKMKRRFFYLLQFNRELVYYKQQQVRFNKQREGSINEVPKVIDLAFAEIRTIPNSTKFVIILPQRQYVLDATTNEEKDSWIGRICDELKSIKEYASKEISMSLERLGRTTYESQKGVIKMLRDKKFQSVSIELRSGFIFIYEMIKFGNKKLIDKLSLYKCFMSEYEPSTTSNSIKIEDQYKKKAFIFQLDDFEDMHFWLNGMKFQQIFIEEAIDNIVLI